MKIIITKYLFTILFNFLEKNNYYYIVFYNYILLKLLDSNFYFLNPKKVNNCKKLFESDFFVLKNIKFRF